MYEKYRVGQKVNCCIAGCNFVNYGPIFKEIPLLESLLNFQKDACNICYIPSKCYHFTSQNGKECNGASGVLQITGSNAVISTCIE